VTITRKRNKKIVLEKTKVRRSSRIKKKPKSQSAMVRTLIWNSEGLRDASKHLFIKETIREQDLDIVAFLETGRSNFAAPFLCNLCGGRNFYWFCLPPHGRLGAF
jgi:hypothetical protein